MFTPDDVRALLKDKRLPPPVVSVYLNTDRAHPEGEKYLASFRHLVHQADTVLARRTDAKHAIARRRLTEALPELLRFLDDEVAQKPVIRGVALFLSVADAPDHEPRTPPFTAFTLPRPLRNQAIVDHHPYIRPLLFLLDQYERVGVITADRNHARIFTLYLGEVEHVHRRTVDTPRRHHQGGWKQMLLQRDVDGHVKAHIRDTVREALRMFRRNPLKRLIVGGSDETRALITKELPPAVRPMVVGSFHAEAHARDAEIISTALGLAHAAEFREEAQRVTELAEALARRPGAAWSQDAKRAVSGVDDTLRALTEQRVQRLLVRRGFRTAGAVCDNCGALSTLRSGACATCQTTLRPAADVIEYAIERAQAEHAEVEFVTESPTLDALGSIGALLRF